MHDNFYQRINAARSYFDGTKYPTIGPSFAAYQARNEHAAVDEVYSAWNRGWFSDGFNGSSGLGSDFTLAGDVSYTDFVTNAFSLNTNCFRLLASVSVTVSNGGRIHNNGADAVGLVGGVAATAASLGSGTNGANGNNSGAAGASSSNITQRGIGGRGGNGGAGTTGAAGVSGTVAAPTAADGTYHQLPTVVTGHLLNSGPSGNPSILRTGTGGAAGGGFAGVDSGSGGAPAGLVVVSSPIIIIVGSGQIQSKGGAGSNAAAGSGSNGSGGGGGGGGGNIFLFSRELFTAVSALIVTGGLKGLKSPGTTATDGVDGSPGFYMVIS